MTNKDVERIAPAMKKAGKMTVEKMVEEMAEQFWDFKRGWSMCQWKDLVDGTEKIVCRKFAKQILSHPDLCMIDRRQAIVLCDINSDEEIDAEDIGEPFMVIPLAEALKEALK